MAIRPAPTRGPITTRFPAQTFSRHDGSSALWRGRSGHGRGREFDLWPCGRCAFAAARKRAAYRGRSLRAGACEPAGRARCHAGPSARGAWPPGNSCRNALAFCAPMAFAAWSVPTMPAPRAKLPNAATRPMQRLPAKWPRRSMGCRFWPHRLKTGPITPPAFSSWHKSPTCRGAAITA